MICKNILRSCREASSSSGLTSAQSKKSELMVDEIRKFYSRRRERELAEYNEKWKKFNDELNSLVAEMDAFHRKVTGKTIEQQQFERDRFQALSFSEQMKEILEHPFSKQTTAAVEQSAAQRYSFIPRKSLFPDPKHCDFFHSTPAQIFDLHLTKTDGFAAKVSVRSASSTAMVLQATVPPKASQRCDPAYGKISDTGLYIKYNPGPNYFSPLTAARQKCTNEYTTAGNPTAVTLSKEQRLSLTGYCTVIVRKTNRQECTDPMNPVWTLFAQLLRGGVEGVRLGMRDCE